MPWPLPEAPEDRLALAKGYPFAAPSGCFLFDAGEIRPIDDVDFGARRPVLAHGSNRAPAQLARKFGRSTGEDRRVPVTRAWLSDYDVVYAAHITRYGAVSSTLQHAPGCEAALAVTWLTEGQLRRMHETEGAGGYAYGRLTAVAVRLESGPSGQLDAVELYLGRHGCLAVEGAAVGLAAVPSRNRRHRALHQEEVQTWLRDRHRPDQHLDEMILRHVDDPEARRRLAARLRAEAIASATPHFAEVDRGLAGSGPKAP